MPKSRTQHAPHTQLREPYFIRRRSVVQSFSMPLAGKRKLLKGEWLRTCNSCGTELKETLENFQKDGKGFKARCKTCINAWQVSMYMSLTLEIPAVVSAFLTRAKRLSNPRGLNGRSELRLSCRYLIGTSLWPATYAQPCWNCAVVGTAPTRHPLLQRRLPWSL